MQIWQYENMPGGVGVSVQADEAGLTTVDDVRCAVGFLRRHAMGDGVVGRSEQVAEDTMLVFGRWPAGELGWHPGARLRVTAGDVGVAPGSPEVIHSQGAG